MEDEEKKLSSPGEQKKGYGWRRNELAEEKGDGGYMRYEETKKR